MTSDSQTRAEPNAPMRARDLMTAAVLSVGPGEPVQRIAQLLLDHRISAVPVVADDGTPIGIVSEGDLIGRSEQDRVARHDWWLSLVTGRQALDDNFRSRLRAQGRTARDVMAAPLVAVTEDASADQIARLLAIHHIKRVPVLREGQVVGIVSRADLLRAFAAPPHPPRHGTRQSPAASFTACWARTTDQPGKRERPPRRRPRRRRSHAPG